MAHFHQENGLQVLFYRVIKVGSGADTFCNWPTIALQDWKFGQKR